MNKIEKFLNKRGPKTLILTIILFVIGLSSYWIQKSLELGGFAILIGILLVWGLLYITKIDQFIFR
ncbi:MAG: hypothetical protein QF864_17285 [SAR202 cluster bacterium]|nr:hypothetical protein [SAR202 cluster bacterium]|tara:strand:- start:50 stop:247 length:198 start_codon:yes stop_codon:yes gene_type:complete